MMTVAAVVTMNDDGLVIIVVVTVVMMMVVVVVLMAVEVVMMMKINYLYMLHCISDVRLLATGRETRGGGGRIVDSRLGRTYHHFLW